MNTKKKILFLVTQSEFGGAQRFIYRLITNLDFNKYDILVAAGPEGNNPDGLLFTLKNRGFKTVVLKFLRRGVNPLFDFLGLIEIYKLIRKQNPDILFLCSSKPGILGSIAGRLAKIKKIVYRIGGWSFNDPWPNWKKKLFILLEKNTARFKDIIINNAKIDTEQAKRLGIKPKKEILTIYNGINVKEIDFLSREEARKILGADNEFIVGTIASFYPTKGLKYLIRAAKILKNDSLKFIVIGSGKEEPGLKNLIKKYNLNSVFLREATYKDYRYLKAFDMFVLPSVKEGFPWTIIEAMGASIPVIATKVGAIPEIIESGKNGILVEPADAEQLAVAITNLKNNEELRKEFSKKGKQTVEEKFNLKQMVKNYEDLFSIN